MSYATLADLIARFGDAELIQLTDSDGTGEIDPVAIARALTDVDAVIEAALLGRYQLPLLAVPDLLVRVGCDLAREALYVDQPTDAVKDRAKQARDLLGQIAAGRMRLDAAKAVAASAAESTMGLVEIVSGRRQSPFGG